MNLTSDRLWCIIGPDSRWRSPSQRDIEVAKVTATWMLARNGHPLSRWCLTSGQQPVAFDQVRLGDPAQRGRNQCKQRVHAIGSNRAVERPGSLVGEAMLCSSIAIEFAALPLLAPTIAKVELQSRESN